MCCNGGHGLAIHIHTLQGGMPDLNTSSPVVRQALWDWANWLTTRYTFDGYAYACVVSTCVYLHVCISKHTTPPLLYHATTIGSL